MSASPRLVVPHGPVLDAPTGDDAASITRHCQDPAIQAWTTIPVPYTATDAVGFLAAVERGWADGSMLTWAVREGGALLGLVGLDLQPVRSAELGYWLAPEARGRGLMARAVGAVVAHAFDERGVDLDRLFWQAFVGNEASRRVAERAGFTVEGTVRGFGLQRGTRRDAWVGTLLR